jgi:hypothetical protein
VVCRQTGQVLGRVCVTSGAYTTQWADSWPLTLVFFNQTYITSPPERRYVQMTPTIGHQACECTSATSATWPLPVRGADRATSPYMLPVTTASWQWYAGQAEVCSAHLQDVRTPPALRPHRSFCCRSCLEKTMLRKLWAEGVTRECAYKDAPLSLTAAVMPIRHTFWFITLRARAVRCAGGL